MTRPISAVIIVYLIGFFVVFNLRLRAYRNRLDYYPREVILEALGIALLWPVVVVLGAAVRIAEARKGEKARRERRGRQ